MKKTLFTATVASILLLTGCSMSKEPAPAAENMAQAEMKVDAETVAKEIAAAEAKYKEVKSMRSVVWRHTKKEIDKAKEFAKNGDLEKAHAAATEAHFQAKAAIEQHEEALRIWRSAMPQALMQ